MENKVIINKYENYKNRPKLKKEDEKTPIKRRNQYEEDLEKIEKREISENEAVMWGFVLGFLLFLILFIFIIIFTI